MRTRAIFALVGLLAGCAAQTPCVPKIIPGPPVKVAVPTRCIDAATVPAEPGPTTIYPDDASRTADALASKVGDLRVWGRSLVAMMGPCTK
jgi:hypothetical protein